MNDRVHAITSVLTETALAAADEADRVAGNEELLKRLPAVRAP